MKKLLILLTLAFATVRVADAADTSYVLIQGPFGSNSEVKTFEWQVFYNPGQLTNSISLLSAVFGTPVDTGLRYEDDFGGSYEIFSAGNTTRGATYIDFGGGSLFTLSFTFDGVKVQQDTSYNSTWSLYVAGGGGDNVPGGGATYPNAGSWTYADDGLKTRTVANGSYDGWVFGPFNTTIAGAQNTPLAGNFTNAQVINLVPEPSSTLLLVCGAGLFLRRRR
jgi:hypothetical protein